MTTPSDLRRWLERDDASTEQATDAAIAVYKQAKSEAKGVSAPWDALADEAKSVLTDIITRPALRPSRRPAAWPTCLRPA